VRQVDALPAWKGCPKNIQVELGYYAVQLEIGAMDSVWHNANT
jgi:hypothetical protein